ncbi:prephenate dehydratase [Lachnospiraceae bacterium MD1]|uniref:Bifunctional chorismate mutase/prephenate dehydratase n=1 Tax=Variimorphobacter saccharofermentans TaxID=2755051 RepID=A0A839K1X4_9FIRM|nr:prephenate dehydratase [Variimorphobacter saccharofermentans]MBB2183626.1 prephenate dehydratase [Variimorphobacter saccharofermentans]
MIDIQESREKIDIVDRQMVELFEQRMKLAMDIAEYKRSIGKPIYDAAREEQKLATLTALTEDEFNKKAIGDLFKQIMSMSRRLQYTLLDNIESLGFTEVEQLPVRKDTTVAFFGENGSYTEQAMLEYFGDEVQGIPMKTFSEVMKAINEEKADYGVLPIENSSTGTLADVFDLLSEYDNYIIGEHLVKIEHNLWGVPGSAISDIKKVFSHRQGLLQCSDFLKQYPKMKQIEAGSTAGCARKILEDKDNSQAAIASKQAGKVYGLQLLKASIQNEDNNTTRFIIISNKKIYKKGAERTSICFALPHKSGSLYHMISHFIYNNINMTKIESRPILGKAFAYRFFVDIEGSLEHPAVKNALMCIKEEALEMKILGSYIPVQS